MPYLFAFFLFLFSAIPAHAETATSAQTFESSISRLESERGGRLGVAVISTSGAPLFSYRPNERFAMCSTFKALLGAFVLSRVDAKRESLDRQISFTSSDILDYAPITKLQLGIGHMTVRELNAASIQYSDNTAANLLLDTVGRPEALTKYLGSLGTTLNAPEQN